MKKTIVLDFDGTIYRGDSSVDFFLFVLRRHPKAIKKLPAFFFAALAFLFHKCSKEHLKERFFAIVSAVPALNREVSAFWDVNEKKIYPWYQMREHGEDVIISASPEFLIEPIGQRLGVRAVIATKVAPDTGAFLSKNCHGAEKVTRFRDVYGDDSIEEFYFDSLSDLPLAKRSKAAYRVAKSGKLSVYND